MRDTLRPYRAIAGAVTQGYPASLHQPRGPAPATPGARISGLVASTRTHRPIPETSRGMRPPCRDLSCCTTAPQIWGQPRGVHWADENQRYGDKICIGERRNFCSRARSQLRGICYCVGVRFWVKYVQR